MLFVHIITHTEQRSYYATLLLIMSSFCVSNVTDEHNIYLGLFTKLRIVRAFNRYLFLMKCIFHVFSNVHKLWLLLCHLRVLFHELASPPGFHFAHIPKGNLIYNHVYMCFFGTSTFFFSSRRGSFLVLSAPWHVGSPPGHHGASLGPGQGPWHVLWGFTVTSPNGEWFRAIRTMQAHANQRAG